MGAQGARPARTFAIALLNNHNQRSNLIVSLLLSVIISTTHCLTDSENLLNFKESLSNTAALNNWKPEVPPCGPGVINNWVGLQCENGVIRAMRLERMNLKGKIDPDSLAPLPGLISLSFIENSFEGPLPDFRKLDKLQTLYLSKNAFSGVIPDDAFVGMNQLEKLVMPNNKFTGKIPSSLLSLPKLVDVRLQGNQFTGPLPDFGGKAMSLVNVKGNDLEGPIPPNLAHMSQDLFIGNKALCGGPLEPCPPPAVPAPAPAPEPAVLASSGGGAKKKLSAAEVAGIVLGVMALLGLIAYLLFLFYRKKREANHIRASSFEDSSNKLPVAYENLVEKKMPAAPVPKKKGDYGKLSFVRDDVDKFDLQDLLRSAAEVLGSGTFGASYKTVITSGRQLVVKRYKQMNNVGRDYFHEHMRRIGNMEHPNLLPLVAFYFRKEEKLLVSDFMENGSLASQLHGNHSEEQPGLDWKTRLKIIKGIARGLSFIYNELPTSLILPYGHLKSSNVLLDKSFEPLLTDYALRPVINPEHAHSLMVAYKSPEYANTGRITRKTDVWNLGILILELLTGKIPENYLTQGYDSNASISTWVNNMVKEKRISEVFDKEMGGTKNSKSEMITLLKIGLKCCEEDVETRLDMKTAVEKIELLNEEDGDDPDRYHSNDLFAYSITGTEGSMHP